MINEAPRRLSCSCLDGAQGIIPPARDHPLSKGIHDPCFPAFWTVRKGSSHLQGIILCQRYTRPLFTILCTVCKGPTTCMKKGSWSQIWSGILMCQLKTHSWHHFMLVTRIFFW